MSFEIPWDALLGGMLLGTSALIFMLFNGKVAGISGILGGLLQPKRDDVLWRVLFLTGMVTAGLIAPFLGYDYPALSVTDSSNVSGYTVVIAGLLVGIGTKLSNGCTSGHGICGMGRFSTRSIVATLTFMATAMITVFFRLHV